MIVSLLFAYVMAMEDNCTAAKQTAVCTESIVQERVDWACKLVEAKGKDAIPEISSMRYDCCGEPNYVWINDFTPKMIIHPIKPEKNGKDLSGDKDKKGKVLFVEFVKAVKKNSNGAWVEYYWEKFMSKEPTPKKSWVKACKVGSTDEKWILGSGTWK